MKKVLKYVGIVILLTSFISTAYSQKSKRTTAWNYLKEKEYEKAQIAIDECVKHEKTIGDAKAWYYRALVYLNISEAKDYSGDIKDPLTIALVSSKECVKLDENERYSSEITKILTSIALAFFNNGVGMYNQGVKDNANETFRASLKNFNQYFETLQILGENAKGVMYTLYKNNINPLDVMLYAAIAANEIGEVEDAKKYFGALIQQKYKKYSPYIGLSDILLEEGDTAQAISVIEKGKEFVTDPKGKKNLTIKELLIYQSSGKLEVLTEKLETAIAEDSENVNLRITLGETYYTIASYHGTQVLLTTKNLDKGMPLINVEARFGDPQRKETIVKDGDTITRYFYGKKYLNLKDKKLDSWKIDVKDDIDHVAMENKFIDKSLSEYKKCLTMTEDAKVLLALNSKLGTVYYNTGVDIYNKSLQIRNNDAKIKEMKADYISNFDMAIPFLNKAIELDPEDKSPIRHLVKIYLLKGDMDKVTELNKKLKN
ncbi:MAG: hypothetical protein U9R42_14305 [Bacteroidota bacterium]|nr:hypothetical protein [Bacteroidota bacterium]